MDQHAILSPHIPSRSWARLELFGSGLCFGLMACATRFASQGPGAFSPGQLACVRFWTGLVFCLLVFRLRPGTFRPINKWMLVTRGLLGGVAALLYFLSLSLIPAGTATLLNNTFPIISVVFAALFLKERPTLHLAAALLVTLFGIALVLGLVGGRTTLGLGLGELAGIASAFVAAASTTSMRALRSTDNTTTIFFAFCLGGLLLSLPTAAFRALPTTPAIWGAALIMGLASIGMQMLMTHSYGALTVPEAAIWQQFSPVASYLWAIPLLGEHVHPLEALGIAVVLGGVLWGGLFGQARRPR